MYKIIISVIGFALVLTGCANVNNYVPPTMTNKPLASVVGSSERQGLFNTKYFALLKIDNKTVSYGFFQNWTSTPIKLSPGTHSIIVQGGFVRSFTEGPNEAMIEILADIKPGYVYTITGDVEGPKMRAWLIANGERASTIATGIYKYSPPDPVYMPIVVGR